MWRTLSVNAPGSLIEDVPPSPAYHFVLIANINADKKVTSLTGLSYLKTYSPVSYYRRSSRSKGKIEKPSHAELILEHNSQVLDSNKKKLCWKCILKEEHLKIAWREQKDWSLALVPWIIVTPLGFAHPNLTCSHIQTSPFRYV
jgi:hypothetical protein